MKNEKLRLAWARVPADVRSDLGIALRACRVSHKEARIDSLLAMFQFVRVRIKRGVAERLHAAVQ